MIKGDEASSMYMGHPTLSKFDLWSLPICTSPDLLDDRGAVVAQLRRIAASPIIRISRFIIDIYLKLIVNVEAI